MSVQVGLDIPLALSSLRQRYAEGTLMPIQVVNAILTALKHRGDDGIWIYTTPAHQLLERAMALAEMSASQREQLPLWGIPFSVKDCIDVAGTPTSAACPAFAYAATETNPAIAKLLGAGAIFMGKTNLDQFATGLVGIRTGYTVPHNAFSTDYIAGGSSSGAALSVAHGLVSFAIGTDTGGSGRVPAGFNNIVGLKPTRGLLSTRHTVEACRTLDCLSIFALTANDAQTVLELTQGYDPEHPFSRHVDPLRMASKASSPNPSFQFGVPLPSQREFFGNTDVEARYTRAIQTLTALGGTCVDIDYAPFLQANELLFRGPWVAERYVSVGDFVETNPESVFPITRKIILRAKDITAAAAFEGLYAVEALKQKIQPLWDEIDCLVVPTTGTAYRIDQIEADPLGLNSNLGYYTNFVNLLDLSAIAIPNGFQSNGIPTGITLVGSPYQEAYLVALGDRVHRQHATQLGATEFTFADLDKVHH